MADEAMLLKYLTLKNQMKQIQEELDEIMSSEGFAEAMPDVYDYGSVEVVVSPNVRFDAAIAQVLFPLGENGENMHLYTASVDSKKAKEHLTATQYEACQKHFPKNKVEIRFKP
jgi:hypothetical protein